MTYTALTDIRCYHDLFYIASMFGFNGITFHVVSSCNLLDACSNSR